jgi:hypothetical protein
MVTKIDPQSQAEHLGIAIGSMITALDGRYIPDFGLFNDMRTPVAGTLTVWSTDAGERTVPIAPGRLGIWFANRRWRSELTYLRGHGRKSALDDDMLVACLSHDDQVDVRETALARVAHASGDHCPTPWESLAAWVAFVRGRYPDAIAYGQRALIADTDHAAATRLNELIYHAAAASGRFAVARTALMALEVSPCTHVRRDDLLQMTASALARQDVAAAVTAPLPPLATLRDQLVEVGNRPEAYNTAGARMAVDALTSGHALPFQVPSDRYIYCPLGPVGKDVALSGIITYEPSANGSGQFAHSIRFGLFTPTEGMHRLNVNSVDINDDMPGMIRVTSIEAPTCIMQTATPPGPTVANHFRITCIGTRFAIEINDTLVCQRTVEDAATRSLGCYFFMSGVHGQVTALSWRIDAASAAKPPVPQASSAPAKPAIQRGKPGADDF